MLKDSEITTFVEASEELGVYPTTIGDLVVKRRITPKPVRRNGMAKGLDASDMQILREALGMTEQLVAAS